MRCKTCHYSLLKLPERRCPECGRGFDPRDPSTFELEALAGRKPLIWGVLVAIIVLGDSRDSFDFCALRLCGPVEQVNSFIVRCKTCHYSLANLTEHRCPECGAGFDPNDPSTFELRHRFRLPAWLVLGLTLLLLAVLAASNF